MKTAILYITWDFDRDIYPIPMPSHEKDPDAWLYELPQADVDFIQKALQDFFQAYDKLNKAFDTCGLNIKHVVNLESR